MDTVYGHLYSTPSSSSSSIGLGLGPDGLQQAHTSRWVPDGSLRKTTGKMSLVQRIRESLRSSSLERLDKRFAKFIIMWPLLSFTYLSLVPLVKMSMASPATFKGT